YSASAVAYGAVTLTDNFVGSASSASSITSVKSSRSSPAARSRTTAHTSRGAWTVIVCPSRPILSTTVPPLAVRGSSHVHPRLVHLQAAPVAPHDAEGDVTASRLPRCAGNHPAVPELPLAIDAPFKRGPLRAGNVGRGCRVAVDDHFQIEQARVIDALAVQVDHHVHLRRHVDGERS